MIEEQCSTCKYIRSNLFNRPECRHELPKMTGDGPLAKWPIVENADWCASWEWDGKCDHSETEPFETGNVHAYTINRCKRCGGRA